MSYSMNQFMAVPSTESGILGKIAYFSLGRLLVPYHTLEELCKSMGLPCHMRRDQTQGAFKCAAGDISFRKALPAEHNIRIFKVYCRENQKTGDVLSSELVKEEVNDATNQYHKLANLTYDRRDDRFGYDNLQYDPDVDPLEFCRQAESLYENYRVCARNSHVDTILANFLDSLEAVKLLENGRLYFVPKKHMAKLDLLEDFVKLLKENNLHRQSMMEVNSLYVLDDAKQREHMAAQFAVCVKKEIEEYEARIQNLLQTGCNSAKVLSRYLAKIQELEERRKHFEGLLRKDMEALDEDYSTLSLLRSEIQLRVNKLMNPTKAA